MIKGIGTDIIEIDRIRKAVQRDSFLQRVFTEGEISIYQEKGLNPQTLAGFFAAKEAFAKALGTGFRGFSFRDVEGRTDNLGKPFLVLSEKLDLLSCVPSFRNIYVSISHSNQNAVAFVILEE